jgi:hypothetical protein
MLLSFMKDRNQIILFYTQNGKLKAMELGLEAEKERERLRKLYNHNKINREIFMLRMKEVDDEEISCYAEI